MKLVFAAVAFLLVAQPVDADSYVEHDYLLDCSGCHRMDGSGSRSVPSFRAMPELNGRPGAREYWVQVPGAAQAPLSDARLAALMNWLLERFTGHKPEPAYTAQEVKQLRSNPLRDPVGKRGELLREPAH